MYVDQHIAHYNQEVGMEEQEGKPLLLIEVYDDPTDKLMPHKLRLNRAAVGALTASAEKYIAPVTMFGPYRSGKSFLLNQLLQRTQGFDVGGTTRACTKGIWIWSAPVPLDVNVGEERLPVDMYFLDCEGTNSLERDSALDSLLATVSIFISSVFLYNSVGAIEERKLEELAALTLLIDRIAKKNAELGFDIQKDFPQLFWVLRDFTLDLETNTPQDYLDQCLADVTPSALDELSLQESRNKNKARKLIKTYFSSRTCLSFCRPADNESSLQKIESDDQIKPEFKGEVNDLMQLLIMAATPKTANKCYMTGRVFFNFVEALIEALNMGEVPMLSTSVERLLTAEAQMKAQKITSSAEEALGMLRPKLPFAESELCHKYIDIVSQHLELLREQISYITTKENYSKLMKQFLSVLKNRFQILQSENRNSRSQNTTVMITNFTASLPKPLKVSSPSASFNIDELSPLRPLYTSYFHAGDTKLDWSTLSQHLVENLFDQFDGIQNRTKTAAKQIIEDLEQELANSKLQETRLKDRLLEVEQDAKEADRRVQQAKDKVKEERGNKDRENEMKDIEIKNLKDKLARAVEKLSQEKETKTAFKEKITQLEGELIDTGDKVNKKESEMQELIGKVKNSEKALSQYTGKLSKDGFNVTDQNSEAAFNLIKELSTNVEILNVEIRAKNQLKINHLSKQVVYSHPAERERRRAR